MGVVSRDAQPPTVTALPAEVVARARHLHRQGVAATGDGRPAAGARHLRAGLKVLDWREADPSHPVPDQVRSAVIARVLISLAYAESELGHTSYGFQLLDTADLLVAPKDRGVLLQQRALMLWRTGQYVDALHYYDQAIPLLGSIDHVAVLCPTLLNRASLYLESGRVRAAHEDLSRCEDLARRHHLDVLAAKAMHNRGYCDLLVGNVPAALAAFGTAELLYREYVPGFLPVLAAAKARALIAAGLFREAGQSLDDAIAAFRRQRLTQEQAEAELLRALAALHAGEHALASMWARRAERRFRRRANLAWAQLAALVRLRADLPDPGRPRALASRAAKVADGLREVGLAQDAEMADLVAVRALVAAGEPGRAANRASGMRRSPAPVSIELLLTRRITRAELSGLQGERGRVLAESRAGLATLQHHRSRLGSVDLQAGVTVLGRELAAAGLDAAFEHGSPAVIFAWSERSRAQAFQIPPVHPPTDPEAAEALAELRQLRDQIRRAELERQPNPAARARCAELERIIQDREWRVGGPGESTPPASLADVLAELAGKGRVVVSFVVRKGRLSALVADSSGVRLLELGDSAVVREATARLLADLDVLAGRNLPPPMESVIRASMSRNLELVSDHLLSRLRPSLDDHDLVLIPTRQLSSVPWGLLPGLQGRPVTVSASASAWLTARRSARAALEQSNGSPLLLVAGPGLQYADVEIDEVAKVLPTSHALSGSEATVAATLRGLDGVSAAHLAAHGHHERENVLFSRLDLVDGPLMAYDIQRLTTAPRYVTLSACDVGRTVVRPGDEVLGFTAALLYAGTANVVASVARVSHPGSAAVMTRYYQEVAAGAAPARALATASAADPDAPFVCFGAG